MTVAGARDGGQRSSGLGPMPRNFPPRSGERAGSIIKQSEAWRLGIGRLEYALRRLRIVAVPRRETVKNRRVGSRVSMASQFLSF